MMSEQNPPAWQILVVAYHSEPELPRLIDSLEAHLPEGTTMAIWSNSDTKRLKAALADVLSTSRLRIEVHGDGSNLGFAEACNRLAALSTSETVMFVNPDSEICAFRSPLEPTGSRIVAPIIYSQTGELQRTFGVERTLRREAAIRLLRREPALLEPGGPTEAGFVSGAAFAVNRRRFLEVGGFDPAFFMYYEDLDFCRRWRESGGIIWVDPRFRVMHIGGVSASANLLLALQRSYESALTFHSRNMPSRRCFQVVTLTEAVVKSLIAAVVSRVGRVDRRTQWTFTRWLFGRVRQSP
jgi:GT2 family glycosyltransferase